MLALLTTTSLAVTAGCAASDPPAPPDDIVFVLAPTMGNSHFDDAQIDAYLDEYDALGDRFVIVVADGSPAVSADIPLDVWPDRDVDKKLREKRDDLRLALNEAKARAEETDLSEAIAIAQTAFRPGATHTLVILSSGLQTAGAMDMTEGRLYAEPSTLVANASEHAPLPSLAGVSVHMPQIGVTVAPQPDLDQGAKVAVAGIWTAYFAEAGATEVDLTVKNLMARAFETTGLPQVTPVDIVRPKPIAASGCRQVVGDGTIGFEAGSARIRDEEAARAVLSSVVAALASCPGGFRVDGSASSEGDPAANAVLSADRANAVAALLADISGERVEPEAVKGWGADWPCRRADRTESGELILDAAIANRAVSVSKGDGTC